MTRPVGPAPTAHSLSVGPRATERPTKSGGAGFAHHLSALLAPRATTPEPRQAPVAPRAVETEDPAEQPASGSTTHAATDPSGSSAAHGANADGSPAGAQTSGSAASGHPTEPAAHDSAGDTAAMVSLAGWVSARPDLASPPGVRASVERPAATTAETGHSREGTPTRAPTAADARPAPAVHVARAQTPARPQDRDDDGSEVDRETPIADGAAPPTDAAQLPSDVAVLAVATSEPRADPAGSTNDHQPPPTASASTDSALAGAFAAAGTNAGSSPDIEEPSAPGNAAAPGPDVAGALLADSIASAPPDRITLQLGADQGSARIQIAISNGTVATRITMPDAAGAAHLATATTELHDALARQGFDTVRIAVPVPPSSGSSPLGHSGEAPSDRTPDRASQQSFTSAQDQQTPGRPQQHPRRQRER